MGVKEPIVDMNQNVDNGVANGEHVELRVGHERSLFTKIAEAEARAVYRRAPLGQHMPAAARAEIYFFKAGGVNAA